MLRQPVNRGQTPQTLISFYEIGLILFALAYPQIADNTFGSGKPGSGASTDQGRIYLATVRPTPFIVCPQTATSFRAKSGTSIPCLRRAFGHNCNFSFYRKAGSGDFRLYSPFMNSIRDLLVPSRSTRSMFPDNDIITQNDIRNRLKFAFAEEEIVEASKQVARGVTGSENGLIRARATSIAEMIRRDGGSSRPQVQSRFSAGSPSEVRVLQFWAGDVPVVEVQVRVQAARGIGHSVEDHGAALERSYVLLGLATPKPVLYTQKFFLLPSTYQLWIETDGVLTGVPLFVSATVSAALTGEAFEERPGELRLAVTPDARTPEVRETMARHTAAMKPAH